MIVNGLRLAADEMNELQMVLLSLGGTIVGTLASEAVETLRKQSSGGVDGMTAMVFRELGIAEERLITLGQRTAIEGMAHFMCETLQRCVPSRGNYRHDRCELHMTQEILATVLGLTSVHVNRVLKELRGRRLADIVRPNWSYTTTKDWLSSRHSTKPIWRHCSARRPQSLRTGA